MECVSSAVSRSRPVGSLLHHGRIRLGPLSAKSGEPEGSPDLARGSLFRVAASGQGPAQDFSAKSGLFQPGSAPTGARSLHQNVPLDTE